MTHLAQVLNLEQKTQKPSMHVRLKYRFQTKDFKTCQFTFLGFFYYLLSILQVRSIRFTKLGSGYQTGSRKLLLQTLTRFEFQQKVLGRVWDKRTEKTWLSSSEHRYWFASQTTEEVRGFRVHLHKYLIWSRMTRGGLPV